MMIGTIIACIVITLGVYLLSYLYFSRAQNIRRGSAIFLGMVEAGLSGGIIIALNHMRADIPLYLEVDGSAYLAIMVMIMIGMLFIDNNTNIDIHMVDRSDTPSSDQNTYDNCDEFEAIYQMETANMEKKACPHCGEEILAIAVMCRYCGKSVIPPEPEPSILTELINKTGQADVVLDMDNPGMAADPEPVTEEEIGRRSTIWFTAVLLGMIALAVAAYFISR